MHTTKSGPRRANVRPHGTRNRGPEVQSKPTQAVRVEMLDPQGTIMEEIADKRLTRDDVADTYAWCLRASFDPESVYTISWPTINKAILERWSNSALEYIKTKAWRIYEGKTDA